MRRILLVDDDERNRDIVSAMLQSLDYHVVEAVDGAEALKRLGPDIDLVVLDVMMPGIDGFEVARRIRKDQHCFDIPIVMATVLTGKEDRLKAADAGANDFISKPIDRTELRVRLASLMRMKDAQDEVKRRREELEETVQERTAELAESEKRYRELYGQSKRREELYRSLLEASPVSTAVLDLQARVKYLNPAFTDKFGWTTEELQGSPIPYLSPTEGSASKNLMEEVQLAGSPVTNLETQGFTKSGSVLDLSVSGSGFPDHEGRPAGYIALIRDITKRKRMEQALMEGQERFKAMFDGAQDCIFVKDTDFRYVEVNPAMIELTGIPRDELLGKTDEDLFDPKYALGARDLETRVLGGQTIETEQRVTIDSRTMILDFLRMPMRNSEGLVTGVCGIARDVTERVASSFPQGEDRGTYPSSAMKTALKMARLAAETDSIILLTGESGSGKDHMARHIHGLSARCTGPFRTLNCAAIPP